MGGPPRVGLRERLLVEWVAQARPGDPFPDPWAQASRPTESIVRTLVELGVIEPPPRGANPAEVAAAASAAAQDWLERNPA